MILGRGAAQTTQALVEEYQQFLATYANHLKDLKRLAEVRRVPQVMMQMIGNPPHLWADEDILSLYERRSTAARAKYNLFLSFLLFRGYYRPGFALLASPHYRPTSTFLSALAPWRARLKEAHTASGYQHSDRDGVGPELELLIWLLAMVQKPLDELTREDFDQFYQQYQEWYRERISKDHHPNHRLLRLEHFLGYLGVLPAAKGPKTPEDYMTSLHHPSIREALLRYFQWSEVKHRPSSTMTNRRNLLVFFHWLQEHYPDCDRLDKITRTIACAYGEYLKGQCEQGHIGAAYRNQLYSTPRFFFNFVLQEQLEAAPSRNPFGVKDLPERADALPRYLPDHELRTILTYCETEASLLERTVMLTLLHTGIRAAELAALKETDIVQIGGIWKLHIHEGKGLKDRMIPLTEKCLAALHTWQTSEQAKKQRQGSKRTTDALFAHHGHPWVGGQRVHQLIRAVTRKLGLQGVTPHRFRHTFAVALLNYGVRESALQKLMGHTTLGMTLEYARILDETVELSFTQAVETMQDGPLSWVPNFFVQQDYTLFAEGDAVSWIRLPMGYCRRNAKLHCESDVKCLLCDRFAIGKEDLPRLQQMHERFLKLGLQMKADVVAAQIQRLELPSSQAKGVFIPMQAISRSEGYTMHGR
jgi:site-specific recombinase XerD